MRSERRRGALRASGKAVWTWPPVVAVDAGAMQIQSWEGAALSRAETVLQGTTPDTVRAEIGYGAKTVVEEGERRDRFDDEAQRCERLEVPRVFELERVVSCRRADPWWRTKLDFGRGESLDDLHRCTALRAAPRIGEVFGAGAVLFGLWLLCRTQQLKAKR